MTDESPGAGAAAQYPSMPPAPAFEPPAPDAFGGISAALPRAGFWARFGAWFVDGIIVAVVSAILEAVLKGPGSVIGTLGAIAYFVAMEGGPRGATFGKQALGLRVVDVNGGGSIGYGRATIRYFGRIVSTIPLFLGYFWMLWDGKRQTWHDKFARDLVVRERT